MKHVTINKDGLYVLHNHGKPKTTADLKTVIKPGRAVFELKDTHGMPFSVIFMKLEANADCDVMIDWVGLIEAAREHRWWDYQTYAAIREGFADSGAWADKQETILAKIRAYMVMHPLRR